MDTTVTAVFATCQFIYLRLQQSKSNDKAIIGLKIRVGKLLNVLEQARDALSNAGGTLDLTDLNDCLAKVGRIADANLQRSGFSKFGSTTDIQNLAVETNQQLDNQLATFTLMALTTVAADTSTIRTGFEALLALVEELRIDRDSQASRSITSNHEVLPSNSLAAPTSHPPRLPSPPPSYHSLAPPETPSLIRFGDPKKPYFDFSNDSSHAVHYQGISYPTATHLFAAFRFLDTTPAVIPTIVGAHSPATALALSRKLQVNKLHRSDWFSVGPAVMDLVVTAKFEQHPKLSSKLRDTGSAKLIFDDPDGWWGIGSDGRGEGRNELGKSLMRVRQSLIDSPLYFSSQTTSHYNFSTTSYHPVLYAGTQHPTCEHLYQTLRFSGRKDKNAIMLVTTIAQIVDPREVRKLADKSVSLQRKDWDKVKVAMLEAAIGAKFDQWSDLKQELQATGTRELIYMNPSDDFWGYGSARKGKNELGKILMRLRARQT